MKFFLFLYNFLLLPFDLVFLLLNKWKREKGRGHNYKPETVTPGGIWVHAASVGEVKAAEPLIKELKKIAADKPVYISTLTPAGQETARNIQEVEGTFYYPFDLPISVYNLFRNLQPWRIVVMETELWPNLINFGKRRSLIFLANGRLGIKKMPTYQKLNWLYRPLLQSFSALCLQSREDGDRIKSLGVSPEKFYFPGNLKLDGIEVVSSEEQENMIVGGSTHEGEEEMLLDIFEKIRGDEPNLKLLLAPRHLERIGDVVQLAEQKGFSPGFWSKNELENPVTIMDVMGQLVEMYSRARLIFVGGSLVPKGGHNPLEALGKPLFFGPYMENWQEMVGLLCGANLAFQVKDKDELLGHWEGFFREAEGKYENLGQKAREFKEKNAGSARQTATIITQEKRKG